jgi:hypothetical protein
LDIVNVTVNGMENYTKCWGKKGIDNMKEKGSRGWNETWNMCIIGIPEGESGEKTVFNRLQLRIFEKWRKPWVLSQESHGVLIKLNEHKTTTKLCI